MSDLMLLGVLRMPLPDDPKDLDALTWLQFRDRAREAADRIEAAPAAPALVPMTLAHHCAACGHDFGDMGAEGTCPMCGSEDFTAYEPAAPAQVPSPHCLWPSRGSCRAWQDKQAEAQPLTDEQIEDMARTEGDYDMHNDCWAFNGDPQCRYNLTNFARAIERAHGIGAASKGARK